MLDYTTEKIDFDRIDFVGMNFDHIQYSNKMS